MSKKVLRFLGENEKSEEIEKLLNSKMKIGAPEHLLKNEEEDKKPPEERQYLLLYIITDENGDEVKSFEFIKGRKEIYNFIKNLIESMDIHESKVLVEGVTLEEAVTVYEFMKHISALLEDTSFDIEDYNVGDDEYTEE